jgi:hypothetical protein
MKWGIAIGLVVLAAGALAYFVLDPFADESDPSASRGLTGTACEKLAEHAGQLAEEDKTPPAFLFALGREAAGIRPGRRGIADLARGGHNRIPGRGFQRRLDDGTQGQVRHFVGLSVATMYGGGSPVRWISEHLRRDPAGTPDGRLSDEGIAFATQVITGRLALDETSGWLRRNLCRKRP